MAERMAMTPPPRPTDAFSSGSSGYSIGSTSVVGAAAILADQEEEGLAGTCAARDEGCDGKSMGAKI